MNNLSISLQATACFAAFVLSVQTLTAQTPTPTPPPCPLAGWAEGLVQYTQPAKKFPTTDTAGNPQDCAFHQWSWEAFVWAMAIDSTSKQPRFLNLPNLDGLDQPALAKMGPKRLMLKVRTLKPRGSQQDNEFQQAGSQGILVDQNGQPLFYSQHASNEYFNFVKQYYGAAAYAKAPPTLTFPVGAAVFKASWAIVPSGQPAGTFYTTAATVPMFVANPNGGIMVDPSGKTRDVTVALVGLHVVGVTVNHPEFLWATFEQNNNSPDLTQPSGPVSSSNFTFYKAETIAANCNQQVTPTLSVANQTLSPTTNVFRQFAFGGASPARVQDIQNINAQAQTNVSFEPVLANYHLVGTVWILANTLKPGDGNLDTQAIASINLANSTLETFVQGAGVNCFSCHNTSADSTHKIPGKDINLSHKLLEPLFNNPALKKAAVKKLTGGN